MKRMSINRLKIQQKNKLKTVENESNNQTDKTVKQKLRYSCVQINEFNELSSLNQNNKKSGFSRKSQLSPRDNILKNILQSNERKRFQMLNNLISNKRKLFQTSVKSQQRFKKLIKIKTEEKQNQSNSLPKSRKKLLSSNINLISKITDNNHRISIQTNNQNSFSSILYQQKTFPLSQRKAERKKHQIRLSQRQSQIIKKSFNKRIKQIKLRKYFQHDQLQTSTVNLFQAYGATLMGQKHKQNQDSMYFSQGIYVLCDGHGSNGKQISSFVCQSIHNSLNQCLQQHKIDEQIILQTFRKIDLELDNSNFDISFSGCTVVSLIRYQNTLFCISLGDSKAILCKGYNVSEISISHKPSKPKQKERIQNYGGVIRQSQGSKDKTHGPMRIWAPGKNSWGPGLALSRAFGDKASRRYGVISVPEITQINLTSDQQFIVIGSDGLTDFFTEQEICQFVRKLLKDDQISKEQIPNELVNEARKKWVNQDADDISCIIIFL